MNCREEENALRIRIFQSGVPGGSAVQRPRHGGIRVEGGAGVSGNRGAGQEIEDARAGADRSLIVQRISEA